MLASNMPFMHFVSHVGFFCLWVDGKDQNRIDFPDFRDWPRNKISLGTKSRNDPKCRDQKCIYVYFFWTGYHNYEGYEVWKWEGHEDQDSNWDNHKKT